MRNLMTGTLALALLVGCAFFSPPSAQDEDRPNAVIEETNVDLGEIYEQEKYSHVFKIKNTGPSKLYVTKVKPG
jgi:hypothetical protein